MSIESLEKIKDKYAGDFADEEISYAEYYIFDFMKTTIDLFKDLITDLQQFNKELRCRENLEKRIKKFEQEGSYFDRVENIKEVRNLNGR